jgi:hypothetical protein
MGLSIEFFRGRAEGKPRFLKYYCRGGIVVMSWWCRDGVGFKLLLSWPIGEAPGVPKRINAFWGNSLEFAF